MASDALEHRVSVPFHWCRGCGNRSATRSSGNKYCNQCLKEDSLHYRIKGFLGKENASYAGEICSCIRRLIGYADHSTIQDYVIYQWIGEYLQFHVADYIPDIFMPRVPVQAPYPRSIFEGNPITSEEILKLNEKHRKENSEFQTRISLLERTNNTLNEDNSKMSETITALRHDLEESRRQQCPEPLLIEKHRKETSEFQSRISLLERTNSSLNETNSKMSETITALRHDLEESRRQQRPEPLLIERPRNEVRRQEEYQMLELEIFKQRRRTNILLLDFEELQKEHSLMKERLRVSMASTLDIIEDPTINSLISRMIRLNPQ